MIIFSEYHKIDTIFKRDSVTKKLLFNEYSRPEFEYLSKNPWTWTEKIDGTNVRVFWDHEAKTTIIKGRTNSAKLPSSLITRLTEIFTIDILLKHFSETSVIFFGEGYGEKIQKAGSFYKKAGVDFILFDVRIGKWWLERESVDEIASVFNIKSVPVIGTGTLFEAMEKVKHGFQSQLGIIEAEGLVLRPSVVLLARNGSRIITKIKTIDF